MRISDANKLAGTIMKVKPGQDMTEVILDIGDQAITATITSGAANDMKLSEGDQIFAVFNSSDVSLIKG
ncbi:molybdate-binding domain of mode [hydrocarbon metagenome]|uniref:Molybdate-binding domain of mode n=1 Tax=hydrocarbon metagenome TaxID=938273 RepID=A0A0W8E4B2_9ZZZZ